MYLGEVGTYASLLGLIPSRRRHHILLTALGFLILCLYSTATVRILLRKESFFNVKSTVHLYSDALSTSALAISVNMVFIMNAKKSRALRKNMQQGYGKHTMRKFWIIHAVANTVNTISVLNSYVFLDSPHSLEYVFFHCYGKWALSLEALIFYALGKHWTRIYSRLNHDALEGRPLEISGRHAAITQATRLSVKQLEGQLLFATGAGFVLLVVLAFYGAETAQTEGGVGALINYTGQATNWALTIVVIARAGEDLHREASQTAKCLHSVSWSRSNDKAYITQLISASMQLRSLPLRLKMWGLLPLDNSLLFKVTGSACTYMVVLLQFAAAPALRSPPPTQPPPDNDTENFNATSLE